MFKVRVEGKGLGFGLMVKIQDIGKGIWFRAVNEGVWSGSWDRIWG